MSNDGAITIVGNQNVTVSDGNSSVIVAGSGNDTLSAGANSVVVAGDGNDNVTVGSNGAVVIGNGSDTITAGANSAVVAGNGNDSITVGTGSAIVVGNGNDSLTAGANSVIVAGNGNDTIVLGANDTVVVGSGKDVFSLVADAPVTLSVPSSLTVREDGSIALTIGAGTSGFGFGDETIVGFNASTDKIQLSTTQFANFAAVMAAAKQVGSDTIITGDSADVIDLEGVRLSSLTASDFQFVSGASVTVTISGIPTGVTLKDTAGALTVTNGSITLTQAQLAGLTLQASEVTTATLTVTATDLANGTTLSKTIVLSVTPVAPTLSVAHSTLTVAEDGTVALGITETPFDSRDTVSLTITGVPSDATLSAGTKNSNGSWTLTPAQLSGLTLKAGEVTTASLTVTATNTQGATASTSTTISLSVTPVAPTLSTPTSLTVNAGATIALGITETPFDARDTVSLTITGVPSDATLSAGTKSSNGSWTLTPAQLSGLSLRAGQATTTTLSVTATNTLGATASTTQTIQLKVGTVATPFTATFDTVSFTDTGVQGDHITSNASVTFSGTFTDSLAVSQVQIFNGTTPLGLATLNNTTHTWTLTTTLAQGTYANLNIKATDSGGNTATASNAQTVQIDTAPPTIAFTTVSFTATGAPGTNITNNGNVTLSGTVSDNVTVSQVQVYNGSTPLGIATVTNGTWSLATTLAQGTYASLRAIATDEAGNSTTATTTQSVQVDTAPPAIAFTTVSFTATGAPGTNITNNGNVTLSGTVSDNVTVSQVQVFNGSTPLGTATVTNGTWSLATTLAQGTYASLRAVATDEAGNTTTATTTQSVQVDTAPPAIAFTTVSFTATGAPGTNITNNGNVTLSGTVSDNVTVSQVQVFNGSTPLGTATVTNGTWSLPVTLAQGTYASLRAVATDEAGNTTTATTTQSVQVDTAPPAIAFTTVSFTATGAPGTNITNNGNVTLSGTVSDNVTVSQVQVFNGSTPLGTATVTNGTWSLPVTLAQGTYASLRAVATDEAGNTTTATTTQSVQVDTAPPAIAFTTVSFTATGAAGTNITNSGNVTLSGTVSDNVTVSQVQVFNGSTPLGTATVTNGTWSLPVTLAQGTYASLRAVATDEAGNTTTATTTQSVQVDTAPPTITFDTVSFIDSGVVGDSTTNIGSVFLSGSVADNVTVSQVQVFNGGTLLGVADVDNVGHTWSLSPNLTQGSYSNLKAVATDEAGNSSTATTTQTVQVDTAPPAITFDTVSFADTGAQGDGITGNGHVTLSGTTLDNVTVFQVQVFNGTTPLGTATVNNTTHTWSLVTTLAQGTYGSLNAIATDEAGNSTTATTTQTVQVDTAPPAITFDKVLFTDTGVQGDRTTSNGNVTLSGTTSDNVSVAQVQVFNGSTLLGTANVTNGTWSLAATLGQGTYSNLNAVATDEAGNATTATTTQTVQVDTAAPTITFNAVSFTDTGVQGDRITNNSSVTLSGNTADNVTVSQVQVFNGGTLLGNATVDNAGHTWTLTTSLNQGSYSQFSATATDEAGNIASVSTTQSVQVDNTAPSITFDSVSIVDPGANNVSTDGKVVLSGTMSDNVAVSQVQVFDGSTSLGLATVAGATWSLAATLSGTGAHNQFSAVATDEAGNSTTANTRQAVDVEPASGNVMDGYIVGATVFADSNGNGVWDSGEAKGVTDQFGHFTLGSGTTTGPLVLVGGTDTATGLPFTGVMTAPTGSTQVTPLTTLVQAVVAGNGGNVGAASQAVASALGIDPSVDLTTLDTVAATYAGSSQAFVAASSILNTVSMVASAVSGTGATDFTTAASSAFAAIATQISNLPTNGTLDLTSATVVSSTLSSVATTNSATLTAGQTSGIVNVVTSVNTATNAAASNTTDPTALLTNVSATSIVAQGSASTQIQQATAPNADASVLDAAVAANTGTNLTNSVSTAVSQVGNIAPAPPQVLSLTPTDSTPTNATLVHYLLSFSDPVTGVNASDFNLTTSGLTGASIASVGAVAGSGGAQWLVTINTGSGDGTASLTFTGTTVQDLAGNALQDQAPHAGPTYTIDKGAIEQAALALTIGDTLINAAEAPNVAFTIAGLEAADTGSVIFSDGFHQVKVNVTGAQASYTADLSTLNDGPIASQLSVNTDAAGNSFTPVTGTSIALDRDVNQQNVIAIAMSGPGITVGVGDLDAFHTVTVTVTMSQPVTVSGPIGPTLTLNDGATANYSGPLSTPVSTLTFTYNVLPGDNTANLAVSSINLNGGTIADLAGNNVNLTIAASVNPTGALKIDTTGPTVSSIVQTDPVSTNAGVVHYTVTFSEAVTNVGLSQFSLTVAGVTGASIASVLPVVNSAGTQYTVAINTGTGSGTIALKLNGATIADLAGNLASGISSGAAYSISAPTAQLWSTSTYGSQTPGDHLYGPSVTTNQGQYNLFYGETASNFTVNGPDTVTQNLVSYDPFFLPFRGGVQTVATYNVTTFPFTYNELLPVLGPATSRQFDALGFYVSQDASGNATIDRVIATDPVVLNGTPSVGTPVGIETIPTGAAVRFLIPSFTNTTSTSGLLSTYDISWDQYNAANQTYQVYVQDFNADNSAASPVTLLLSQTGVTGYNTALGWFFRAANGNVSADALLSASVNVATNSDVLTFQGYAANGSTTSENFTLTPDLSHYAAGATSSIVQSVVNPPTRTGSILPMQYAPNQTGGGYSAVWDETVTDSNGVHNQVEFEMFKANSTVGSVVTTGSVQKQVTFQITDGLPQQMRVGTFTYNNQSYEVLAYGDVTSSHVVEFDSNGNIVATYSEATNQFFNQLEVFGDGRIGLSYDNVLDSSGTTEFTTNIIDLRTSGIPNTYTGIVNVTNHDFAGTQFNDSVVGVNNANNTYYYVGRNTTGQGPSDTFTGTLNGGVLTAWNTAIFADARSNYTISTVGGVTTLTNVGDSAHAGTLTTTNVQELAFNPGVDPTPLADGTIVADGTVVILGQDGGIRNFTIDNGATLELDTPENGTVTFAGSTGTLLINNASSVSTINAVSSAAPHFTVAGQGSITTTSGNTVGINAVQNGSGNLTIGYSSSVTGQAGDGVIAEQSATGTGNIVVNGLGSVTGTGAGSEGLFAENLNAANAGNITVTQLFGASGSTYGVDALQDGNGNISIETAGTVSASVQNGIRALSLGTGSISVTTDAGSVVNSGGSGIVATDRATMLPGSSGSTISITANGTINAGNTLNLSGSNPSGLLAGYNGATGLASTPNANVTGTVTITNNANITETNGQGIDGFNYGNGDITVNDGAGTSVTGSLYGIVATTELTNGTGNVTVNVAANANVTGTRYFGIQATNTDTGNVSVTTSTGDLITSGSSGINANDQATSVGAGASVTVTNNGTIHSGAQLASNLSNPNGINAGYFPGGAGAINSNVAGNVVVQNNGSIVAAGGNGINAYNYGVGSISVTTGGTSSTTSNAALGIGVSALDGGNASVTNGGAVSGTTGIGVSTNLAGTATVINNGQVTGTTLSGINVTQNAVVNGVGATGSANITNTGTVVAGSGHSAINVVENPTGTVTITNSGTIGSSAIAGSSAAITENGGTFVLNNTGQIDGSVLTNSTGGFTGTFNNNAGGTWQAGFLDDEGTIISSGAGSAITILGNSTGMAVGNTATGNLTLQGGSTFTGDFINIGMSAGSHGTVTVTGAGTTLNTTAGQFQNIFLGQDGTASMTISNQAVVSTTNMGLAQNFDAGVTDTLDINNATLNVAQGISIGNAGTAHATVENGGNLTTSFLGIASQAGSTGSVTATGTNSVVSTAGIGFGSSQSSATLSVSSGGAIDIGLNTAAIANAVHVGSSGQLQGAGTIQGNLVNDGSVVATGGVLDITGSVTGTGITTINNGATLKLESSASFAGTVAGLAVGDFIDLADLAYLGNATPTYSTATGKVTVTEGSGAVSIALTDGSSSEAFVASSDGNHGTLLTVVPVSLAGTATGVTVNQGQSAALPIVFRGDTIDTITISGVPLDASLSAGTNNGNGSWTLTAGQLANLQITAGNDSSTTLTVTATDDQGRGTATQQIALTVSNPVGIDAVQNGDGDLSVSPPTAVVNQAGDGIIAEQSATGTGNIFVNATGSVTGNGTGSEGIFAENLNAANTGNITITALGGASGSTYGVDALQDGNGNISIETAGTVSASVQNGIRALSLGTGSISVTTDAGSVVNSGGSGIVATDRATVLPGSSGSTLSVTANGTINGGNTLNLSGSNPSGILVGYNGATGTTSTPNPNVNGTVTITNNANITETNGYGIDGFNYGNGDITVNDNAGTSVTGSQYGIAATALLANGTGNVTVNVAANANVTGTRYFGIQATNTDIGNVSVTTSAGDLITSGSSGINANDQATLVDASKSVTVTNNGTIHSGAQLAANGSNPAGINAGYVPNATTAINSNVAGNVVVQNNGSIVAAGGNGINAYNYGVGNISVTTGGTSSTTSNAALGIGVSALDGGNASVTNGGAVSGTTGIGVSTTLAGSATVTNNGQVTGTSLSGINVNQTGVVNSVGATGSTSITNTGTVVGGSGHSAINVVENPTGTVTINNNSGGTIGVAATATTSAAITVNGGAGVVINNNAQVEGGIFTNSTGGFTGTFNNNAGATWQSGYIDDEGTIVDSGAGALMTTGGASIGMVVGNSATGNLTVSAGASLAAGFVNIGQNAGSHGTVTVTGAGTILNTTTGQYQNILLGQDGTASMTVSNQAVVTTTGMEIAQNFDAGVTDTLDVNGGTLNITQGITVGGAGTAHVTVEGGGSLTTSYLNIAAQTGGTGSVVATGANSVVSTAGIGFGTSQSSATLGVNNGGSIDIGLNTTAIANAVHVGSSGQLQGAGSVQGNLVNDGSVVATGGVLDITGSVTGTGITTINNGATLKLESSASFAGTVAGLTVGDTIDLADLAYLGNPTPTYSSATGQVTVSEGSSAVSITLTDGFASEAFVASSDGNHGTLLTVVPVSLVGTATAVTVSQNHSAALPVTFRGDPGDTIVISGVPLDATLSAGTNNGNGSWTLTPTQLVNLQITAANDSSTTLTVTATDDQGRGSASQQIALTVNPALSVSVPASLTVTDGGSVMLNISLSGVDAADAGDTVTITGVPTDMTLSLGTNVGNGSWTVPANVLANLKLIAGPHAPGATQTIGTVQLTVTALDPTPPQTTSASQTINVTVAPDLWASTKFPTQTVTGTHTYGSFLGVNGSFVGQLYGVTASNYSNAPPDVVSQEFMTLDPFLLPYQSGIQTITTATTTAFSIVGRQLLLPTLNSTTGAMEGIGFYLSEDQSGIATINRFTFTDGASNLNAPVSLSASTPVESGLIGQDLEYFTSFTNNSTGGIFGTGSTYSVSWGQYNATTQTYSASFQTFNPNNTTASPVEQIFSQANVASETAAPAWYFRSAGTNGGGTIIYGSAVATLNTTTGLDYIQFQSYNSLTGVTTGPAFQVTANLGAYAAGATNQIVQIPQTGDHTSAELSLQYIPNTGASSGFSFGWSETVTDSTGTHEQVEFAIYKPVSSVLTLFSQNEFQIADGQAQNIRLTSLTIGTTNVTVLAYGDNTGTHLVEFNQATGAIIASFVDPTTTVFGQITSMGDGRIAIQYDNEVDANGTTQYTTNIYDLRTAGLNLNDATLGDGKDKYIAGTQYTDAFIGENGVNNTYAYVGQNTNTGGPVDAFTGGTSGWNVAILPDAQSNYTITTINGVTGLVNTGDPAHAGTLNVSGVQALAFAPTVDPSGNSGSLEATGDTLEILGPLPGGGEPISIDNGSKLELATADSGTVTFAGPTGTLKIDTSSTFTGTIGGQLAIGDVIDLADITAGANATLAYSGNNSPGTLTVSDGTHTANILLSGNYSIGNFIASSDGHGGTSVVDPPIGSSVDASVALLTNYMASSFTPPTSAGTPTTSTQTQDTTSTLAVAHQAAA